MNPTGYHAELGLAEAGDDADPDAMMAHPVSIDRWFVETARGVRPCRPQDAVREILYITVVAVPAAH